MSVSATKCTRPLLNTPGPSRCRTCTGSRTFISPSRLFPQPPPDPHRRLASTTSSNTEWLAWLKKPDFLGLKGNGKRGKALMFAGLGSYPHTPSSPTPSSIQIWEQASEALLMDDPVLGYQTRGMEEFAGGLAGSRCIRGWMRGWVEGRSLDELMARADVTAAFILTSSIAILASAQEMSGSNSLLPPGTTHLAGHGFIGTLTSLVASSQLDLPTAVRLARIYANLPASPSGSDPSPGSNTLDGPRKFATTVLSARQFHSLATPPEEVPLPDEEPDYSRKRSMQLILDEIHALQKEWDGQGAGEWAEASIINSSKVLVVTGTHGAVGMVVEQLQGMNLATPVLDVHMPCPYNTKLMAHAEPDLKRFIDNAKFTTPNENDTEKVTILDPVSTIPMTDPSSALLSSLGHQLRWHKTLSRLYQPPVPEVETFLAVGKGAKGLGVMLRGEVNKRPERGLVKVEDFGVGELGIGGRIKSRAARL